MNGIAIAHLAIHMYCLDKKHFSVLNNCIDGENCSSLT